MDNGQLAKDNWAMDNWQYFARRPPTRRGRRSFRRLRQSFVRRHRLWPTAVSVGARRRGQWVPAKPGAAGSRIISKKVGKSSLSEQKKFGRNYATLIFALPKRNKGAERQKEIEKKGV